jgi:hypothetical protein
MMHGLVHHNSHVDCRNAVAVCYWLRSRLELRRGAAVSLSGMERNILLIYVGWELVNLFLGGVLSASLVR